MARTAAASATARQDEEVNLMSTEQACYALAAYVRNQKGESTLFDMTE